MKFSKNQLSPIIDTSLTVVDQASYERDENAAELQLKQIDMCCDTDKPLGSVQKTRLIVREST